MNEAKILLHYALSKKEEELKLGALNTSHTSNSEIIQACKIISDCLPNDETNMSIKNNLSELLPKMLRMLPFLPKTLEMLITTFIDKFVATADDVSSNCNSVIINLINFLLRVNYIEFKEYQASKWRIQ